MKTKILLISILTVFVFANAQTLDTKLKSTIQMEKVIFNSAGLNLVGNLYLPTGFDTEENYSAVVVGGSLTSVKEQMAGTYAKKLAEKGLVALAFDYRNYGESEGLPRQFEDPQLKLEDLSAAVSFLESLPYVNAIGGLGVCTSSGNMAYLAASDSRVKAIAMVASWIPSEDVLPVLYGGEENIETLRQKSIQAKKAFANTGINQTVIAYSNTDKEASHFGPMEYYMDKTRGGGVKEWKNEFAVMSWETWLDFDPMKFASDINAPLMMIHSDGSALPDNVREFYEHVPSEKELVWLEGNHFDFYDQEPQVEEAIEHLNAFFNNKL